MSEGVRMRKKGERREGGASFLNWDSLDDLSHHGEDLVGLGGDLDVDVELDVLVSFLERR